MKGLIPIFRSSVPLLHFSSTSASAGAAQADSHKWRGREHGRQKTEDGGSRPRRDRQADSHGLTIVTL
ncbi:MAG TPA: hypothetical protein PKY46_07920 [Ignavibacteriaceae bacterium]|nr:hypothetical protein [Ignavibacteriaceae bacterium]